MPRRPDSPPNVSRRVLPWFQWYVRRYLRKSFHTVCLSQPAAELPAIGSPLIVYVNHASWWDPLVAIFLAEQLTPERRLYAPFDAEALSRYPIFEKLGFFGVEQGTRRGAAQFLRTSRAVLDTAHGSIWITPEGRFVDPRDGSAEFEPGLAHLAEQTARGDSDAYAVPLAIEYAYWEEKLPEVLCEFGEPIRLRARRDLDKTAMNELLVSRLRAAQASLAKKSIARDPAAFRVLIGGAEGVGGVYEPVRWLHAKLTGQTYRAAHSEKLTSGAGPLVSAARPDHTATDE